MSSSVYQFIFLSFYQLISLSVYQFISLSLVSVSIYHAMQANRLDGMSGLVIGSMRPWVEAIALTHGKCALSNLHSQMLHPFFRCQEAVDS